jgi:ubiquinone/menaquinone biosynthesis C-methylase UbiE
VGFYSDSVAPRLVDVICSPKGLNKWRARCVEGLTGEVVEVGFGAGRNLLLYPSTVTKVIAIEPSPVMRSHASKQIVASPIPVTWGGLDGQRLDLANDSADAAVVTFSLCTIPDPVAALRELRRVVRSGGELRVLEHGLAPDESVATWQRRLDPVQKTLAGGCHLTRDPVAAVAAAGWTITADYHRFAPGPKFFSYFTSLRAI